MPMDNAVKLETGKDNVEAAAPERAEVPVGGSCPTCRSGLDPTILGGDFQDALRESL
jgi:hypothetical protein